MTNNRLSIEEIKEALIGKMLIEKSVLGGKKNIYIIADINLDDDKHSYLFRFYILNENKITGYFPYSYGYVLGLLENSNVFYRVY